MARKKKIDLSALRLAKGAHDSPKDGVCLMEAVAYVRGIKHTDHPPCVCPTLGGMGRSLNDLLGDDKRQNLIPLIPSLIGTAGDGMRERRGLMAADWIIRTYTPTWLRLAKLNGEAAALEALPEVVDTATMQNALGALNAARKSAAAARAAAGDAAWDAAGDAAWDAAGDAAWDAAGAAARAAAGDAAWDAARAAAGDAAWDAARAAAGDAARAAAGDAAGDAAWDAAGAAARAAAGDAAGDAAWDAAWDAARAAAGAALKPTVEALQDSALDLYRRMAELRPADTEAAA